MTDPGPTTSAAPSTPTKGDTTRAPRYQNLAWLLIVAAFAVVAVTRVVTWGDLPSCDSREAKDTLSDIFKKLKFNPKAYDQIARLSSDKDNATCRATFTMPQGPDATVDYAIARGEDGVRVRVTKIDPPIS